MKTCSGFDFKFIELPTKKKHFSIKHNLIDSKQGGIKSNEISYAAKASFISEIY